MSDTAARESRLDVYGQIRRYHQLVGSDITFAFQTIVDATEQEIVGYEALVRGTENEPASLVMSRVQHDRRFDFDQACRIRAIEAATNFDIDARLHLNCTDIKAGNVEEVVEVCRHVARRQGIEFGRIVLELNNLSAIGSRESLETVHKTIRDAGFLTLIDNFGRRDADLRPVAQFQPEQLKIAQRLVERIHERRENQAIVKAAVSLCRELGITVIASGVETVEEFRWLHEAGIEFFQGYFFTQPGRQDTES